MNNWISVKDKLPNKRSDVLCVIKHPYHNNSYVNQLYYTSNNVCKELK